MLVTAEPLSVLPTKVVAVMVPKFGVPVKVIVSPAASPNVTFPFKVTLPVTANVPPTAVSPVAPTLNTFTAEALSKFKRLAFPPADS